MGLGAACNGAHAADPEAYQGVLELEERALGFEVGGRVASIAVARGAPVEEGTELAALDDTLDRMTREAREAEVRATEAQLGLLREGPREEEIRAARAELRAARASEVLLTRNLERQRMLVSRNASAPMQTDELTAQLARATAQKHAITQRVRALEEGTRSQEIAVAEARLAAARTALAAHDERLARHRLLAGAEGTVLDVHVEPGEVVAPGAPVVTIADLSHPYVDVFVPQGALAGIEVGAPARVRVDAHDRAFRGVVEHVARRTEFTPRYLFSDRERPNLVVRIRVRIDDPEHLLSAGVPAFATLDRGAAE